MQANLFNDLVKISSDYQELFQSGKWSDVTLVVGDTELKAHKLILSARSPVFAALFVEMQESKVTITDVSADVLQEVLRYIYTGKVEALKDNADKLLAAADKVLCMLHFGVLESRNKNLDPTV